MRARLLVVATAAAALALSGLAAVSAPASASTDSAAPAPAKPMAKVKCVSKSTGFARYAKNGVCKRSERIDRKPCAKGGSCVVGDAGPGGGRVFFAARTQQSWGRYLEVAPRSWNPSTPDALVQWCSDPVNSIPGTQATGIGDGRANTAAMVAVCGPNTAATVVAAYQGGGKSDWYLASRDELRALFLRQKLSPPFELRAYWSSSEASPSTAWGQDFYAAGNYDPAPIDKMLENATRPIRAF